MITKPVNIGMLYPILQRNKQCLKIKLLNSGGGVKTPNWSSILRQIET